MAEKKTKYGVLEWDEETNLPALPKGQFWRVRPAGSEGLLVLHWMGSEERTRPRSWWDRVIRGKKSFTWEAEWHCVPPVLFNPKETKLADLAASLVSTELKRHATRQESQKYVGDYPPKRAED